MTSWTRDILLGEYDARDLIGADDACPVYVWLETTTSNGRTYWRWAERHDLGVEREGSPMRNREAAIGRAHKRLDRKHDECCAADTELRPLG